MCGLVRAMGGLLVKGSAARKVAGDGAGGIVGNAVMGDKKPKAEPAAIARGLGAGIAPRSLLGIK